MLDICVLGYLFSQTGSVHIRVEVVTALWLGEQTAREVGVHTWGLGEGVQRATEIEFSENLIM